MDNNVKNEYAYNESYKTLVWESFTKNKSSRFSNGAPIHASIILEAMLTFAKNKVRIFCEDLDAFVYDRPELVMALKQALARNVIIEILTQKYPKSKEFKNVIESDKNGLAWIHVADSDFVRNRNENFAIMDMRAFRFEPDKRKKEALACANEPISVGVLDSNFSKLLAMSKA